MEKFFIPIKVDNGESHGIWQIDVTGLSISQLIKLKEELKKSDYAPSIVSLDNLIYNNMDLLNGGHKLRKGAYSKEQNRNIIKNKRGKKKVRRR